VTKIYRRKIDIGLLWAKYVNTWGQVGSVAGTVNLLMMLGVFYTTTLRPILDIPLWLYIMIVVVAASSLVLFVLKIGISGYYRFFNKTSELGRTYAKVQENNRKLELIMQHLGIDENPENGN